MGRDCERAWPLLALLLLTSCGGGGDASLSATQMKPDGATATQGQAPTHTHAGESLVVIRYDWDRDAQPDVLTLDTSRNPLVIVEAIRGTRSGVPIDATAAWRGREIEGTVNEALQLYLARSCSVGSQTDLELILDGVPETVTVIE